MIRQWHFDHVRTCSPASLYEFYICIYRRQFLKTSLGVASAVFAAPQIVRAETLGITTKAGANSRSGMGFIGMGLISNGHVRSFPGMKNVQTIADCDVRDDQLKRAADLLKKNGFNDILATSRFEEMLANPDIQAVCVSTPDHWHAAIAMAAMKAGKDVYVEKPMSLTIEEGKKLVAAEKKGPTRTVLDTKYDFVVILPEYDFVNRIPEATFDGVLQMSRRALNAGSTPLLLMPRGGASSVAIMGENSYRIGNGCRIAVVPGGYAVNSQSGLVLRRIKSCGKEIFPLTPRHPLMLGSSNI